MPAKFNTEISERIAVDTFGDYKISTVLLKNTLTEWGNYETMIMYKEEFLDYQERCDTLGQAHMQHENAITTYAQEKKTLMRHSLRISGHSKN